MNDDINNSNDSSVEVVQPNKFGNSSKDNSHNSIVIVESSQSSDIENTECSEDESKTSPLKKITMVGAQVVISSPGGPPTSPLTPPPQSWTVTSTSTTIYSFSAASLAGFFAQYSLPPAAATSHKSHVPLATCSAATKDSVKTLQTQ